MDTDWGEREARTVRVHDQCLWCKGDLSEADDAHDIDTGEQICQQCLGDLREFKRTTYTDLIVSGDLQATTIRMLLNDWEDFLLEISKQYQHDDELYLKPTRTSNAERYEVEPTQS